MEVITHCDFCKFIKTNKILIEIISEKLANGAAEADRVAPVVASSPNSARNQTQNAVGPTQLYSKYDVILFPGDQMVPDTHVMGGPTERKEARSEAVLTSDRLFRRTLPFKLQLELQLLLSSIYLA